MALRLRPVRRGDLLGRAGGHQPAAVVVAQVRAVAGGEKDGVHRLLAPVLPNHAAFGEAGEHRPPVGSSGAHRGGVGPVVHDAPGLGDVEEAPEREAVEAGDGEPEVEVPPEDELGHEADRGAGGEGGLGDLGQLVGPANGEGTTSDAMNAKLSRRRNRFTLLPVVLRIVLVLRVHADN
jgi:hypothetical protein